MDFHGFATGLNLCVSCQLLPYPESLCLTALRAELRPQARCFQFDGQKTLMFYFTRLTLNSFSFSLAVVVDTGLCGVSNNPLGPALHAKFRVHPRNFHNLHLNICI